MKWCYYQANKLRNFSIARTQGVISLSTATTSVSNSIKGNSSSKLSDKLSEKKVTKVENLNKPLGGIRLNRDNFYVVDIPPSGKPSIKGSNQGYVAKDIAERARDGLQVGTATKYKIKRGSALIRDYPDTYRDSSVEV